MIYRNIELNMYLYNLYKRRIDSIITANYFTEISIIKDKQFFYLIKIQREFNSFVHYRAEKWKKKKFFKSEIRRMSSMYQWLTRQVEWSDCGRPSSISHSLTKTIE